jgi:hypothetical protein
MYFDLFLYLTACLQSTSTVLLCLPLSVSSAVVLIAVSVCTVFHNKSLTVDAIVLYIFKTCAALV